MKILATVPFIVLGAVLALAGTVPVASPEEGGFRFDWTITLGQLVSAILLTAAVVGGYARLMTRITAIEVKVSAMWHRFIENREDP